MNGLTDDYYGPYRVNPGSNRGLNSRDAQHSCYSHLTASLISNPFRVRLLPLSSQDVYKNSVEIWENTKGKNGQCIQGLVLLKSNVKLFR